MVLGSSDQVTGGGGTAALRGLPATRPLVLNLPVMSTAAPSGCLVLPAFHGVWAPGPAVLVRPCPLLGFWFPHL